MVNILREKRDQRKLNGFRLHATSMHAKPAFSRERNSCCLNIHSTAILIFFHSSMQAGNEDMLEMVMDDWLKKVDLNHDDFVTMDEFLGMCN